MWEVLPNTDNIFTQDQSRQIAYGIRKGNIPIKFTYLTELGSQWWKQIESERVDKWEYSMDTKLFDSSIESYLEELGNPEYLQIIDIGGWYGYTARSLLETLKQKWIWIHYHTIDISPILLNACQRTVSNVSISQSWHLLDIDDGWVGRKIREIKEKHPHLPILITFLGNTIWNFVAPQEVIRQISEGMDTNDRLILWAHLFREWYEKKVAQEYNIANTNIHAMLSGLFNILCAENGNLKTSTQWHPDDPSIRWYIEFIHPTIISIRNDQIELPWWYAIEVLRSKKFSIQSLLELIGNNRVAQIKTDIRWLYSQIMLAPNSLL